MNMTAGMKVVGYVRVSTEEQARTGISLEAQKQKIRAWAEAMDAELISIEEDAGISGKLIRNREGLQKAIERACEVKAAIVVYSLSRLSRSTRDTLTVAERLDRAGADLVSLSERIDTTTAAGKMVFRMLAVLNEFERDQVSERTAAILRHKKENGQVYSPVPFGYDREGDRLVENEDELLVVELVKNLRRQGCSLRQIASDVNAG
jgi:site-specific DNA recombinase